MKTVILAGGFGTRLSEETSIRPKPMVEVGGKPLIWHIMKIYAAAGFTDFVVSAGYKSHMIKEYFANYYLHMTDLTFDLRHNRTTVHASSAEPWMVTVVDTGGATMTGGRIKRVGDFLGGERACVAYGDCVADLDIATLVEFHRDHGRLATVTAVQPSGRFGVMQLEDGSGRVTGFHEKPRGDGAWVNGGFFVLEPEALDYIEGDTTVWEREPLERLAAEGQLAAYRHEGFWQPVDTLRDKMVLEELWESGDPPWRLWPSD